MFRHEVIISNFSVVPSSESSSDPEATPRLGSTAVDGLRSLLHATIAE